MLGMLVTNSEQVAVFLGLACFAVPTYKSGSMGGASRPTIHSDRLAIHSDRISKTGGHLLRAKKGNYSEPEIGRNQRAPERIHLRLTYRRRLGWARPVEPSLH